METFSVSLALCAGKNSPHKDQWHGALVFCLICVRINDWINNREAGDLRRHRAHHDVTVMTLGCLGHNSVNTHKIGTRRQLTKRERVWDAVLLCLLCGSSGQLVEGTVELPVIWDVVMLVWRYYNPLQSSHTPFVSGCCPLWWVRSSLAQAAKLSTWMSNLSHHVSLDCCGTGCLVAITGTNTWVPNHAMVWQLSLIPYLQVSDSHLNVRHFFFHQS